MAFVKKAKSKPVTARPRWLGRFFWLVAAVLFASVLWYAVGLWRAYRNATVTADSGRPGIGQTAQKGPINVLLVGVDQGKYLADSIMVASIDSQAKSVSLLSIPRDLYVAIPGHGHDKINAAHSLGQQAAEANGDKAAGPNLLARTISATLGIPVHYFVRLDFDGFRQIIDALGGIDLTVEKAIRDPYYPDGTDGYITYSVKAGPQHMTGEQALKFARSRETSSDFDRAARQQKIFSAVKAKIMTVALLANPAKATRIVTLAGNHILTDLSARDLTALIALEKDWGDPAIYTQVLDNSESLGLLKNGTSAAGAYILIPAIGIDKTTDLVRFARGYLAKPRVAKEHASITLVDSGAPTGAVSTLKAELERDGLTVTVAAPTGAAKNSVLIDVTGRAGETGRLFKDLYGLTALSEAAAGVTTDFSLTLAVDWPKRLPDRTANSAEVPPLAS